ncbi:MAG: hypothetical protein MZV64_19220 [Ignavibacteriales bacterium]|nr:hypothetical protein [Ignavibacteriales bacterium]
MSMTCTSGASRKTCAPCPPTFSPTTCRSAPVRILQRQINEMVYHRYNIAHAGPSTGMCELPPQYDVL